MTPDVIAQVIKERLAEILPKLHAEELGTYDDPDTPGLQFNFIYQGRKAQALIVRRHTGDYRITVSNRETLEIMYERDGIELEELPKVFAEDLAPVERQA